MKKQHRISTKLPKDIPAPKFELFQQVQFTGKDACTATISGMSYIDFGTAILNEFGYIGWSYELNLAIGKSQDELLGLVSHEVTFNAYEDQIQEVAE